MKYQKLLGLRLLFAVTREPPLKRQDRGAVGAVSNHGRGYASPMFDKPAYPVES